MNHLVRGSLIGLGVALFACSPQQTSSVSEVALTSEVKARPYIRYQCYFFDVPEDFLKSELGEEGSSRKIYSQSEGDQLVKKLQTRRGFKLSSTPAVKCRNGKKGKMQLVSEFIYPTEYSPPEIPKGTAQEGDIFPVTPSSPESFEMREIGLEASFQGKKNSKGVVEFDYEILSTDFLGFINYGSPITAPARGLFGQSASVVITENRIEMPVFDTKKISSQATLKHGQYLAIGKWGEHFQPGLDKVVRKKDEERYKGLEASPHLYVLIQVELSE